MRGIQKETYSIPLFLSLQMNRTKGDEEEYWNSSKFKAFTFDDEDDDNLKKNKSRIGVLNYVSLED